MLVIIVVVGPLQDALFGVVLVANALIGIVQEVAGKTGARPARGAQRAASRASCATVRAERFPVGEVVLDDMIELRTGDQVAADGVVRTQRRARDRRVAPDGRVGAGREARSATRCSPGSVVVAGSGRAQATRVGDDAYARRLATEARRFTLVRSELGAGIDRILRLVTWALAGRRGLLAFSQFQGHHSWRTSLSGIVAGVVAAVPEGLVLLSSLALAVATLTLARRRVLGTGAPGGRRARARRRRLPRQDGHAHRRASSAFNRSHPLGSLDETALGDALGALADDEHPNATLKALGDAFPRATAWERVDATPFSSARKWSSATFADHGIVGASARPRWCGPTRVTWHACAPTSSRRPGQPRA